MSDKFQELTNNVIKRLEKAEEEQKKLGWSKPWLSCYEIPKNLFTNKEYAGVNIVSLWDAEFTDPRWMTYKQIQQYAETNKIQLSNKGSKGFPVFFTDKMKKVETIEKVNKTTNEVELEEKEYEKKFTRVFTVFNASQIIGLEPYKKLENKVVDHKEIELLLEAMMNKDGLKFITTEQGRAYYQPSTHTVHMPQKERFKDTDSYYLTLLHELGHSTSKSLDRKVANKENSNAYAFEELVAELNSMFTASQFGIDLNNAKVDNHSSYIGGWLEHLKKDKTYIIKASQLAGQATGFLLKTLEEYKQDLIDSPHTEKMKAIFKTTKQIEEEKQQQENTTDVKSTKKKSKKLDF